MLISGASDVRPTNSYCEGRNKPGGRGTGVVHGIQVHNKHGEEDGATPQKFQGSTCRHKPPDWDLGPWVLGPNALGLAHGPRVVSCRVPQTSGGSEIIRIISSL